MLRRVFIVSLLVLLTACGTSPKTNFYVLDAESEPTFVPLNQGEGPVIVVWAVKLPDFLDRSEIVTRNSQYEIELADFSWWAGDLGQNMTRLLGAELSHRLQTDRIVSATWGTRHKKDFQIKTHIVRFDGELGGEVILKGIWVLLDGEGKKELSRELFEYRATAADKTYKGMVTTLSQLMVQLSEKMADSITAYQAKLK